MILRRTKDREQDRAHLAQPGKPVTLALRYAVRSDVGLLREGNEDSAYAGPHLPTEAGCRRPRLADTGGDEPVTRDARILRRQESCRVG